MLLWMRTVSSPLPPDDLALTELIAKGEGDRVEFKESVCWNTKLNKKDDSMRDNIIQEVAAFLNSRMVVLF